MTPLNRKYHKRIVQKLVISFNFRLVFKLILLWVLNTKLESKVWIASKKNEAKLWNKSLLGEELLSLRTLIEFIDLGVVFPSQYRKG